MEKLDGDARQSDLGAAARSLGAEAGWQGRCLSQRHHAEAGIAAAYCLAPSYAETDWEEVVGLYDALERIAPSPLNVLNRAIALAEWKGPDAGLAALEAFAAPSWLEDYYLWHAALGELYRRCGRGDQATLHTRRALASAPTNPEKALLERRLSALGGHA